MKAQQEERQQTIEQGNKLSDNFPSNLPSVGMPPESVKMFSATQSEKQINPAIGFMTVRNIHEINWDLLRK